MKTEEKIKLLKDKLYTKYGISFSEDDPAWLMTLINHDIISDALIAIEQIEESSNLSIENYQNIENVSSENLAKFKEILHAINILQMNANKIQESINVSETDINSAITRLKTGFKNVENNLKVALKNEADSIENNVVNALLKIDYSPLTKNGNALVLKLEEKLTNQENRLDDILSDIIDTTDNITNKANNVFDGYRKEVNAYKKETKRDIEQIGIEAKDAVDHIIGEIDKTSKSYKGINKSVTMLMSSSLLVAGVVIGFGFATFFKIEAVSNYYFSSYDEKQKKLEADQIALVKRVATLEGLPKFLFKNDIYIDYNTFTEDNGRKSTGIPFIAFKKHQLQKEDGQYNFERSGKKYIGFRNP